jgi:hypothetical protein
MILNKSRESYEEEKRPDMSKVERVKPNLDMLKKKQRVISKSHILQTAAPMGCIN